MPTESFKATTVIKLNLSHIYASIGEEPGNEAITVQHMYIIHTVIFRPNSDLILVDINQANSKQVVSTIVL